MNEFIDDTWETPNAKVIAFSAATAAEAVEFIHDTMNEMGVKDFSISLNRFRVAWHMPGFTAYIRSKYQPDYGWMGRIAFLKEVAQ